MLSVIQDNAILKFIDSVKFNQMHLFYTMVIFICNMVQNNDGNSNGDNRGLTSAYE